MSSGGECGREFLVLTVGVAPLSWWFSGGSVLALASSRILILLVWEKNTVGSTIALISHSATSSTSSSFLVCPARSGVLAGIVGKFSVDLTLSHLLSLSPILSTNVTSLS